MILVQFYIAVRIYKMPVGLGSKGKSTCGEYDRWQWRQLQKMTSEQTQVSSDYKVKHIYWSNLTF